MLCFYITYFMSGGNPHKALSILGKKISGCIGILPRSPWEVVVISLVVGSYILSNQINIKIPN